MVDLCYGCCFGHLRNWLACVGVVLFSLLLCVRDRDVCGAVELWVLVLRIAD